MSKRREMTLTCERILMVLDELNRYYGKLYCYPSAKWIQKTLKTQWGVDKSIRQIYRSLKWLVDHEYIERRMRVRYLPNNQWRQQSSISILLGKAYEFFKRVKGWVLGKCHKFRMTYQPYHKLLKQGLNSDISEIPQKTEKPPPENDPFWENFKKNLDNFKAFLQTL
jgi:hypothetical protein